MLSPKIKSKHISLQQNKFKTPVNTANHHLTMLQGISKIISEVNNLTDLCYSVVQQLTRYSTYQLAILYLTEEDNHHLYPVALSWQAENKTKESFLALTKHSININQIPLGITNQARETTTTNIPFLKNNLPIKSTVFVPFKRQNTTIGFIGIGSTTAKAFTPDDECLMVNIAHIVAIAISHIQLIAQQEEDHKVSDTLKEISAALVSSLDLDKTLTLILDSLERLLDFDSAAIYLLSANNRLRMVAAKGMPAEEVTMASSKEITRLPLDETVISNKTALAIPDVRKDNRWTSLTGTEYIRSWLGVPLVFRDKPIGMVTIDRSRIDPFTNDQLVVAEATASHAAIAIENARLFSQVKTQQNRLRKLSNRVVEAQEEERRRISRELHDEMGQALTAIKLNLQMFWANLPTHNSKIVKQVNDIIALVDNSLQEVRRLSMDLRPSILDDLGLEPTLKWYQNQFQKRSNTNLTLLIDPDLPRLTPNTETALYRIVQEALTNVSRHAHATQVKITLKLNEKAVYCTISDDGEGFKIETINRAETMGVGLTSMYERIEALHGQISIESKPNKGTSIFITIPSETALNLAYP